MKLRQALKTKLSNALDRVEGSRLNKRYNYFGLFDKAGNRIKAHATAKGWKRWKVGVCMFLLNFGAVFGVSFGVTELLRFLTDEPWTWIGRAVFWLTWGVWMAVSFGLGMWRLHQDMKRIDVEFRASIAEINRLREQALAELEASEVPPIVSAPNDANIQPEEYKRYVV